MPSNAEYAQRQFRAQAAERAEKELMEQELRALRSRVQTLEERLVSLSNEVLRRRVTVEDPRGFS